MANWTEADIPDQTGRTAFITGANTGIGFEAARALAGHGARVLMGCRDQEKAVTALDRIRSGAPEAELEIVPVDVSSLESVRDAAAAVGSIAPHLDLLINNAGIMATPRWVSVDGYEMQFATNHLGHFALTGLLLGRMIEVDGSRVVSVSSNAHKMGRMNFDDLQGEKRYRRTRQYAMTKLANLHFIFELQRRLGAAASPTVALACHPGSSQTELARNMPGWMIKASDLTIGRLMQDAARGALPTLRAATDPAAQGGQYYGPDGRGELKGPPVVVEPSKRARSDDEAARLWSISEELTGVEYPI